MSCSSATPYFPASFKRVLDLLSAMCDDGCPNNTLAAFKISDQNQPCFLAAGIYLDRHDLPGAAFAIVQDDGEWIAFEYRRFSQPQQLPGSCGVAGHEGLLVSVYHQYLLHLKVTFLVSAFISIAAQRDAMTRVRFTSTML